MQSSTFQFIELFDFFSIFIMVIIHNGRQNKIKKKTFSIEFKKKLRTTKNLNISNDLMGIGRLSNIHFHLIFLKKKNPTITNPASCVKHFSLCFHFLFCSIL